MVLFIMTYFVLPYLNNIIHSINIKLKFKDKSEKLQNINPSLKKYLNDMKNLISNYLYEWDNIKRYTNTHEFIHTSVPKYKSLPILETCAPLISGDL